MSVNPDCSTAPAPVHGVVEFVVADWRALYPQFPDAAPTLDAQLELYFDFATMIVNNTCKSIVVDGNSRERLLYLLVAHIAAIQPPVVPGGGGGSGLVGRVDKATEGTVSISAAYADEVSESMAWFIQSPYGATFWQMTSKYRSFRYVAPDRCCGPAGFFPGRRG